MKIAFIKRNFIHHGGAERYLATLINILKKEGHEIHIFANKWTDDNDIVFHKVKILPFSSFLKAYTFNRNLNINLSDFQCVISFERTTCQHVYRAGEGCHISWLGIRSKIEPFYKKLSFKINPLHLFYLKLEKQLFEQTPLIIANSNMVKNEIIRYYKIPQDRIIVIYNGVDIKRFSPENKKMGNKLREKFNLQKNTKIILFIGSGFKRKGLDVLLQSLPYVKNDFVLFVIGKGDIKKYSKMATALGIKDKIIFFGVQKEIEKFYAASDLFVLPTIYDPFSNATLEAMASGIAVITTKNNGVSELIEDGKEGYVITNCFDRIELAEKINTALNNLQKIGYLGRKKAEEYSIEYQVKHFLSVINNNQF